MTLWQEQVLDNAEHDNSHLWELATTLLESPFLDRPMYSRIEWIRYQITLGMIEVPKWDCTKPFPYAGMLISAVYFQEAARLCAKEPSERVWHLIATAYYYLGLNTTPNASQSAAKAAKARHAEESILLRGMVCIALEQVEKDGTAKSIRAAKEQVIEFFTNNEKFRNKLKEIDAQVPEKMKHNKDNDDLERLRNRLDNWANPNGPYPEIADAFSTFSAKKNKPRPALDERTASDEFLLIDEDTLGCYLRIYNIPGDGFETIVTLSRDHAE